MYITTSKKPSLETRNFSKKLAFFFGEYGKYENRGRKTINNIIKRARKLGHSEVLIVSEKERNPRKISKIKVFGSNWSWKEEIEFDDFEAKIEEEMEKKSFEVKVDRKIKKIFEIKEPMSDDFSTIKLKNKEIIFKYGNSFLKLKNVKIK